jgi:CheY-like chemotaxis protein
VREVTETLLAQLGYRVIAAADAATALATLAAGTPIDLVFSDIVMPGAIDGVGLARQIARDYPGTAVLLTTGYSRQADALEREFPILHKPYQSDALSRAVRDALARKRDLFDAPARLARRGWRAWIRSER